MKDRVLKVCGAIFLAVSFMHLLRVLFGISMTVGSFAVPVWWSAIGFAIALVMAVFIAKALR